MSDKERRQKLEEAWRAGGSTLLVAFNDFVISAEAKKIAQDFVRDKIRATVQDEEITKKLLPHHTTGCKRLCLGTKYYETYNRQNVSLIQLDKTGIERVTPGGVVANVTLFELDDLILATGFDAMTGALSKINIEGQDGLTLREARAADPRTYLRLMTHSFPNFVTVKGPGSPSVLSNMLPTIEHHVDWIGDCLNHLRER